MKLLSMSDLRAKGISYSRPHLHRLIRSHQFPKPCKLGANRNAWLEEEIESWIEQKIVERDAGAARPRGA